MVVREQDGTLRHASPSERDRYVDVYYPRGGKMYSVPKMFREGLEVCNVQLINKWTSRS